MTFLHRNTKFFRRFAQKQVNCFDPYYTTPVRRAVSVQWTVFAYFVCTQQSAWYNKTDAELIRAPNTLIYTAVYWNFFYCIFGFSPKNLVSRNSDYVSLIYKLIPRDGFIRNWIFLREYNPNRDTKGTTVVSNSRGNTKKRTTNESKLSQKKCHKQII